ncbi:hypothetical protein GTQ40_10445 [Flavobacteriaceae bacterium R38]|nr:hypothetical protein [Flavobacteriaceae bacterium R38]
MMRILSLFAILILFGCTQKKESIPLEPHPLSKYYQENLKPFYHGVASGDPLTDRVIIWTRVTPDTEDFNTEVFWEVATDSLFKKVIAKNKLTALPENDYTIKIDVTGLNPGTSYYYRFKSGKTYSITGTTKTLPEDNIDQVKFAVVSCSNYEFGYFNGYQKIGNRKDINAVLHLGDYIYEYPANSYEDKRSDREHYPAHEIITLADYRDRYSQYRLDEDLMLVHQKHPFIAIWDDHEIANNSYKTGAQNHQEEEGRYEDRKNAAKKAYYEWLPVRETEILYRNFKFGNLANLIMLDERLEGRTGIADSLTDPVLKEKDHAMLGNAQLAWFKEQLNNKNTQWKLIGNQVIFSYLNWGRENFKINLDSWDGYPEERNQIKNFIVENQLKNIVFVTGDTHSSWAFEVTDDPKAYLQDEMKPFAIEFGTTSINSGNSGSRFPKEEVIAHEKKITNSPLNPHLKYANLRDFGYLLITLNQQETIAEWFYVDSNLVPETPEQLGKRITVKKDITKLILE